MMRSCPQCGYQNPPEIHICLHCAASLNPRCPRCQADVPWGDQYCGQCGASIAVSRSEELDEFTSSIAHRGEQLFRSLKARVPGWLAEKVEKASQDLEGQRREVTILQVLIENFHHLSQDLNAESLYLAIDDIMHILTELVYTYEGSIDKFTGQGLTILFGYPLNHENDAERAVRAALEMQQVMQFQRERLRAKYDCELSIKCSLATGFVIARRAPNQGFSEYTVIGDTFNHSLKLLALAPPRGILCSVNTYQRTRPVIEYLPDTRSEAMGAYQPIGIRVTAGMLRGLPGLAVPMIGRSSDLHSLLTAFEKVRDQRSPQIVLCSGEAGIGKSRLMAEFRQSLHATDAGQRVLIAQGTCAAYMRITPYRVIAEIIRNLAHISEQDSPEQQYTALRHHLEQVGFDASSNLPYLLEVLGLLHIDPMLGIRVRMLTPEMLQRQIFLAVRNFLLAHTNQSPMVLIFDDLQWIDPASSEFIQFLCRSSEHYPFFLLLVARDFTSNPYVISIRNTALQAIHEPIELSIKPLTEDEERHLLDIIIPDNQPQALRLKKTICARACGNPYFTEELVRVLIDNQHLEQGEVGWRLRSSASLNVGDVPGSLQGVILARFDLLPTHLAKALQKASVLGESFTPSLFQRISGDDRDTCLQHLLDLEQRGFLLPDLVGSEQGYRFKHPLLREAIYGRLLKRDLHTLHTQIAHAIESDDQWLPGDRDEILAYHYSRSANPSKAINYLLAASEKAAHNAADELAIQHLRLALSIMAQSPENTSTLAYDRARLSLARSLKLTGEFEESEQLLNEILERHPAIASQAHDESGDRIELYADATRELADIRSRQGQLPEASRLLAQAIENLGEEGRSTHPRAWQLLVERLSWVFFMQSDMEKAYTLADLALMDVALLESENPITLASLYNTIGGIYWSRSRLTEAIESVTKSLQIYSSLNYQWGKAIALTNLGVLHFSLGKWTQAVEYLEQADELRSEYGYDPERATNLKNLGEILIQLGEHERARAKLQASQSISARLGMGINQAYAEFGLARLCLLQEDLEEASEHLQNIRSLIDVDHERNERSAHFWILQASYQAASGDLSQALENVQRAIAIIEECQLQDDHSDALRLLGNIYVRRQEFEFADQSLQQALQVARDNKDPLAQGQALADLGRAYQSWGAAHPSQARQLHLQAEKFLDQAISIFESLGARYELDLAQISRSRMALQSNEARSLQYGYASPAGTNEVHTRLGIPPGEWRQAVLVCIQITPKFESDEELVFATIDFFIPALAEMVTESGAQILRHTNGLTAIFGAQVVAEDDAERAINLAMQVLNFYNELYGQTEFPITLRLALDKGRIVAGWPSGEKNAQFIAAGEALQTALQLVEVCPPAHIWVTDSVRKATEFRFEFKPVAANQASNLPDLPIFELIGLREQILPVRGLIGLQIPFVGRRKEIQLLQDLVNGLESGAGALVWVVGESGVGKSRLMRELANLYRQHNLAVWSGVCSLRSRDIPFSLFSSLLAQLLGIQPHFTSEQIRQQIDAHIPAWPRELLESRPFLELLLGAQPDAAHFERISSLEPEQLRRQTFVAFHRLVNLFSSIQPIVLILDDVQWIDASSADLLLYLSHLVVSAPILMICVQRSQEPSLYEQTLRHVREIHPQHSHVLEIHPLSDEECQVLLDETFTMMPIPEYFRSLMIKQSGGNPYFIEEFIRILIEQGYLRVNRGKLEINQQMQIDALSIPSSLEAMIQARVDTLPASTRQLLQIASVIGGRFHPALLRTVAMEDEIQNHLEILVARGMLRSVEPSYQFEFSHPLIETIVYNTVLRAQRKLIHKRTAAALEQTWSASLLEHVEELAYHYSQAEMHEPALNYLILAGERACARHANEVALGYFERASEMLSAVPNASPVQFWRIICGMGDVHQFTGNYEAAMTVLQSGDHLLQEPQLTPAQKAGLYRRKGDTAFKKGEPEQAIAYLEQALAVLSGLTDAESQAEAARIYARMGWSYFIQSKLDEASQAVLNAEAFARSANDWNALAAAENLLGGINFRQGRLEKAVDHTQRAMEYWQSAGYTWGVAVTLSNLGVLEVAAGNWQAAYDAMSRSLQLRREMGDVEGVAANTNNLGSLCLDQGKLEEAEAFLRDSLAITRPFRIHFLAANSCHGLATALTYLGKLEEVPEIIKEGKRLADELNARDVLSELHRSEAEYFLVTQDPASALASATQAYQIAVESGNPLYQARGLRIAALASLKLGQVPQALEKLQTAWDLLQRSPDELETARWRMAWAIITRASDPHRSVAEQFELARQAFIRLGASYDLEQLQAAIS